MVMLLDATDIRCALEDLAERIARHGSSAQPYVAGGAAMVLAHGADHATRDIDVAIVDGYEIVTEQAACIARERGWPTTWLNEQATPYMPPPELRQGKVVLEHPGLVVTAASAQHMLAMKARAARRTDISDVRRLVELTGIRTVEEIDGLVQSVFPEDCLGPRQSDWLREVINAAACTAEH